MGQAGTLGRPAKPQPVLTNNPISDFELYCQAMEDFHKAMDEYEKQRSEETMSDGCEIDDKAQRPSVTKKASTCKCAQCETMECGLPKHNPVDEANAPKTPYPSDTVQVPLDKSVEIPEGYEVKTVAFANPGDTVLTLVEGKMIASVYNSSTSLFPCIILQKKRYRAKKLFSYQFIEFENGVFVVRYATDVNGAEDDKRYASHNYFRPGDQDGSGEASDVAKTLQECWDKTVGNQK